MNTFIHDIDLGPKPDARAQHRLLYNGKRDPLLLAILHYLRDESACCADRAADATRDGQAALANMEIGARDILVQAFTKINGLRNEPMEIEPEA